MLNSPTRLARPRSGAMSTGCIVGIAVAVLFLGLVGIVMSRYNSLATGKVEVASKMAEIDNQYRRRFELIPQLEATVKGAANFEKATLESVINARASVGQVQLPADLPEDPARLQQYLAAQQSLSGALSRLMVVAEQYPELKANANFRDLQSQLEGTENRIAVARRDYIDSIKGYNRSLVTFPGNIIAGMFNFKEMPQLAAATEAERQVPKVEFDFGKDKEKK